MAKDRERRGRKGSIAVRLTASILICILCLLIFNWLFNNFALVTYYQGEKKHTLEEEFKALNTSSQEDDWEERLDNLGLSQNISALIWNSDGIVYDYRLHSDWLPAWPSYPMVELEPGDYRIEVGTGPQVGDLWLKQGSFGRENRDPWATEEEPKEQAASGARFITLVGRLSNGNSLYMRTPVAAIEDSVGVMNQFLLLSGGVTLALGILIAILLSRSFTRPIRELSHIAGNVARMDFSARYTGKSNDELSDLGRNINAMSAELQETISNLKTANAHLMSDVEQKTRQTQAHQAFISNISHELKTPIALIQTYAEGLRENIAANADNREFYCSVIEDEAQKMSELIKRMTMLMQLETGGEQLEIERFDICELLRNLMIKNQVRAAETHIQMVLPLSEPTFVWADAYLVEHVLTNYISNALHHVSENGTISGTVIPVEDGRVRISIFNTGAYIPEEELPKIWDSFYKVDKARTREYGGSGIGLSVVTAIMKAHRMPYGVVNRESPYGGGVEFYIELQTK